MTLIRTKKDKSNPWVQINKTILTDKRLSWKAKGIYVYAFSRPDDWTFYVKDLVNQSTDGRDAVRAGLQELEQVGYLERIKIRNELGQIDGFEWIFHETIDESKIFSPETGFPASGFPATGNRPLLINDYVTKKEDNNNAARAIIIFPSIQTIKTVTGKDPITKEFSEKLCEKYDEAKINELVNRYNFWQPKNMSVNHALNALLKNWDGWEMTKKEMVSILEEQKKVLDDEAPKNKERAIALKKKYPDIGFEVSTDCIFIINGKGKAPVSFKNPEIKDFLNGFETGYLLKLKAKNTKT
jgi:hypothetical protein